MRAITRDKKWGAQKEREEQENLRRIEALLEVLRQRVGGLTGTASG